MVKVALNMRGIAVNKGGVSKHTWQRLNAVATELLLDVAAGQGAPMLPANKTITLSVSYVLLQQWHAQPPPVSVKLITAVYI